MSLFGKLFQRWPEAAYTEPGDFYVVLQLPGPSTVPVVRELRRTTGCDLETGVRHVQQAPVVVAQRLSQVSADGVVERLRSVGARAVAHPMENL